MGVRAAGLVVGADRSFVEGLGEARGAGVRVVVVDGLEVGSGLATALAAGGVAFGAGSDTLLTPAAVEAFTGTFFSALFVALLADDADIESLIPFP